MMTKSLDVDASPTRAAVPDDATRNKLVITLLLISAFVVILNETIMGVAVPRLMEDLGATANAAQWLTTVFLLTMAVVIPVSGYLLERFTTRTVFLLAMTTFIIGTFICAVSPGLEVLIFGRGIQAAGTAIMMPLLMTTVMHLVPAEKRGKIMGNISIVISVAPAIGPTISGFILSMLSWRWMFILVLPIALFSLLLGVAKIQNVTTTKLVPLDAFSVLLSAIGFGGLVYALSALGETKENSTLVSAWLPILASVIALAMLVHRQLQLQNQDRALLDLRVFRSRTFAISAALMSLCMMTMFGALIILPIYLQNVLGLTTLETGLMLLPGGLVMGLCSPIVGQFYDRHGARRLVLPGTVLVSLALWALTMVGETTPVQYLVGAHVCISIGLALIFTPLFTASLGSLSPRLYSHGSAVLGTVQMVSGGAGTALFIALMTLRAETLTSQEQDAVSSIAGGAHAAFLCGAGISLAALVCSFFVREPQITSAEVQIAK